MENELLTQVLRLAIFKKTFEKLLLSKTLNVSKKKNDRKQYISYLFLTVLHLATLHLVASSTFLFLALASSLSSCSMIVLVFDIYENYDINIFLFRLCIFN